MLKNLLPTVALISLCANAAVASEANPAAQLPMKPGLWQTTLRFSGEFYDQMLNQMLAMKRQLDQLPPEQRQLMERMMAANGVSLRGDAIIVNDGQTEITSEKMVHKECITQQQIDQGTWSTAGGKCTLNITPVGKNRFQTSQKCERAEDANMEGEVTFHSTERFSGKGTASRGQGQAKKAVDYQIEGERLSVKCGGSGPTENPNQTPAAEDAGQRKP